MLALALEALFTGVCFQSDKANQVMRWQKWRWVAAALLLGTWLVFSLIFGQERTWSTLNKWKWVILGTLLVPLFLSTIFSHNFFRGVPVYAPSRGWVLAGLVISFMPFSWSVPSALSFC
jgi:hypothetical protein